MPLGPEIYLKSQNVLPWSTLKLASNSLGALSWSRITFLNLCGRKVFKIKFTVCVYWRTGVGRRWMVLTACEQVVAWWTEASTRRRRSRILIMDYCNELVGPWRVIDVIKLNSPTIIEFLTPVQSKKKKHVFKRKMVRMKDNVPAHLNMPQPLNI